MKKSILTPLPVWTHEDTVRAIGVGLPCLWSADSEKRTDNKKRIYDKQRRYRIRNRDKYNEWGRARRTSKRSSEGRFTAHEFLALVDKLGHKCLHCGRTNVALQADHIMPVSCGGTSFISNIQPLCGPCNSWKNRKYLDLRPDHYWADWT